MSFKLYESHLRRQGFKLSHKIGSGLSGATYKASQPSLNRNVAIKFFDSNFHSKNKSLKEKFLREAQLLAELQHPSIPYVITVGEVVDGDLRIPYYVMQFLSGMNLDDFIQKVHRVSFDEVLVISKQILGALNFSHENKILHRDVKPSNIMILENNYCYLIDYSIGVKTVEQTNVPRNTITGQHLGSIDYMSPEHKLDMKHITNLSDIYSFGLVLLKLATGVLNFKKLNELGADYPSEFKKLIEKACDNIADNRFQSALEMYTELKKISKSGIVGLSIPRKAICANTSCEAAQWSPRGYYKGPSIYMETLDSFCVECGMLLLKECPNCSIEINTSRFCGGCGEKQFEVPECKRCGSHLTKRDMKDDTGTVGCLKCRRPGDIVVPSAPDFSENLPF